MTLIGHNTSAKWEAIRSENLKKTKLTTTNQTYIHRGLWGIQTVCFGGPASGTEPEQLSVVEVYWNSSRISVGLI